jgi:hypothetical protein
MKKTAKPSKKQEKANKEKAKAVSEPEFDNNIQLDNIQLLTKSELNNMKFKKLARFLLSLVQCLMALANATGSQSDIVHYCIAFYYG